MTPLLNAAIAAWFILDAVRELRGIAAYSPGEQCVAALFSASCVTTAWYVLRRRPARACDTSPRTLFLVAVTLAWPFLFLLRPVAAPTVAALVVKLAAAALVMAGSVAMGPAFSLLPARRAIVTHGPFRLVRHPFYAAYLLFGLAEWAPTKDALGALIWIGLAILLTLRARAEESLLAQESAYREYKASVPWRFIPGIL